LQYPRSNLAPNRLDDQRRRAELLWTISEQLRLSAAPIDNLSLVTACDLREEF